jgi:hypothetical protein
MNDRAVHAQDAMLPPASRLISIGYLAIVRFGRRGCACCGFG